MLDALIDATAPEEKQEDQSNVIEALRGLRAAI